MAAKATIIFVEGDHEDIEIVDSAGNDVYILVKMDGIKMIHY